MLFPNPDDDTPAILQKAEVEIVDQTVCHSTYGLITSRMLCAGIMSGKRDSCKVRISLFFFWHAYLLPFPPNNHRFGNQLEFMVIG